MKRIFSTVAVLSSFLIALSLAGFAAGPSVDADAVMSGDKAVVQ